MAHSTQLTTTGERLAVRRLFATGGPVLVEVRFPASGTSPDWYLCEEDDEIDPILDRVMPGAELHCSRVWDLANRAGAVELRK